MRREPEDHQRHESRSCVTSPKRPDQATTRRKRRRRRRPCSHRLSRLFLLAPRRGGGNSSHSSAHLIRRGTQLPLHDWSAGMSGVLIPPPPQRGCASLGARSVPFDRLTATSSANCRGFARETSGLREPRPCTCFAGELWENAASRALLLKMALT